MTSAAAIARKAACDPSLVRHVAGCLAIDAEIIDGERHYADRDADAIIRSIVLKVIQPPNPPSK